MDTELLPRQDSVDADELLNTRIRLISKHLRGGLGEFFERLQREREERESVQPDPDRFHGLRLTELGRRNEASDRGDD